MNAITTRDGISIYYRDWGSGEPVLFSHGWPLTGDAWETQMTFLAQQGYRVIAHDRRGHGRSDHPGRGSDMDHFADDLADLIEALDLRNLTLVGHSTGGGEVTRYVGRHGTDRVARIVLMSAVPPGMHANGVPMAVFDDIRAKTLADRSQFYQDLTTPFFGANRDGAQLSQGARDTFWLQGMMGGLLDQYDCIKAFSETVFNEDLKRFDVPTLLIHGDDDQIVPIDVGARRVIELVPHATLKEYPGSAHGLSVTETDRLNQDLLAFLRGESEAQPQSVQAEAPEYAE